MRESSSVVLSHRLLAICCGSLQQTNTIIIKPQEKRTSPSLEASWSWPNREIRFQSHYPWKQPSLASSQTTLILWSPTRTFFLGHVWAVNSLPTVQETWVRSLGREDPQEKEMATHSSILAWRILWTKEPGRLQSMGLSKSQTQLSDQTTATSLKLKPKTAQQKKVKTHLAMFQYFLVWAETA